MDSALFDFWFTNFLLPEIGHRKKIIIENSAFLKSQQAKSIINDAGCCLIFLPPYSLDFSPIEVFLGNVKRVIHNTVDKFKNFHAAIDHAFQKNF